MSERRASRAQDFRDMIEVAEATRQAALEQGDTALAAEEEETIDRLQMRVEGGAALDVASPTGTVPREEETP